MPAQYEVTGNGVDYVAANGNPHNVGELAISGGLFGVRVKGTSAHTPSDTVFSLLPFTVAPPLTDIVFNILTAGIARNPNNNVYTWGLDNNANTYGQSGCGSHRKLLLGADGAIYMKGTSLGCYLGVHASDTLSFYASWEVGMIYSIYPYIFAVDGMSQIDTGYSNNAFLNLRIIRRSGVWNLEGTNNSWIDFTVLHVYSYSGDAVLYPAMDIYNSNIAKLEGAKLEGFTLF